MQELSQKQKDEFDRATKITYKDQCCHFLNAFWDEHGKDAEDIWKHNQTMVDLDKQLYNALPPAKKPEKYAVGHDLDEFFSHKFLETIGKTMTAIQFRTEFNKIDQNVDKRMGMLEYLLWEYKRTTKDLLSRPQGSGEGNKELEKAQALLDEVSVAFNAAEKKKDEAVAAENELKSEMAKLKEQEDVYNKKTKELEGKAEGSGVAAMRAKNELAQHLGEDPLPLRKAKLST